MVNMKTEEKRIFNGKIITIPNMMSLFRLALIPFIVYFYIAKKNYSFTLCLLIISAVTDVCDGIIARKFDLVSDIGKALDPLADKLTQASTLFCLVFRFRYMLIPLCLLVIKEILSGICAYIAIKRSGEVQSADWHGKVTTVLLYATMMLHILWINIPESVSNMFIGICVGMMIFSFVMYIMKFMPKIKKRRMKK